MAEHVAATMKTMEPILSARPVLAPVQAKERIATLDVLRGVAILCILLVNIEYLRGSDIYLVMGGRALEFTGADSVLQFLVGWLVAGKFMTSFALLFGIGAAILTQRAFNAGAAPHGLLARRYAWLAVFGLLHMFLLFYADILFLYSLAGFLLLLFIKLRPRTLLIWAGAIFGATVALTLLMLLASMAVEAFDVPPEPQSDETTDQVSMADESPPTLVEILTTPEGFQRFILARRETVSEVYTEGSFGRQFAVRASEAVFLQAVTLFGLPWILMLFLCGLAIGRSGILRRLPEERRLLLRVVAVCIPLGLVLNIPLGMVGTLASSGLGPDGSLSTGLQASMVFAQFFGVPVLAVGYLSALALLCITPAVSRSTVPLQRVGRMALTAYLMQSLLCWGFFVGLGYYDKLSITESMLVVLGVWTVVLLFAWFWMGRFEMGPVERVWRRLTYGPARSPAGQ